MHIEYILEEKAKKDSITVDELVAQLNTRVAAGQTWDEIFAELEKEINS